VVAGNACVEGEICDRSVEQGAEPVIKLA